MQAGGTKLMNAIDTIIVGAGGRGNAYGDFGLEHPHEMRVVGVAEPDAFRLPAFRRAT